MTADHNPLAQLEALTDEGRTIITAPADDAERLHQLAQRFGLPNPFHRAVDALERHHERFTNPYAWAKLCIADLKITLGLEPLARMLAQPPGELLTEDERHELQEAIWSLGEDIAVGEEAGADNEADS